MSFEGHESLPAKMNAEPTRVGGSSTGRKKGGCVRSHDAAERRRRQPPASAGRLALGLRRRRQLSLPGGQLLAERREVELRVPRLREHLLLLLLASVPDVLHWTCLV